MTVLESILFLEDIIDKYSSEYFEPSEILSRIKRYTINVLDDASRNLDVDVNLDIVNLFSETFALTSASTPIDTDTYIRLIEAYSKVGSNTYPAFRRTMKDNSKRDPFMVPEAKYPVVEDRGGKILFEPWVDGESFAVMLAVPTFGSADNDKLINNGTNDIGAYNALLNRVFKETLVSMGVTQYNQVLQYEWAMKNKLERDQSQSIGQQPQQE